MTTPITSAALLAATRSARKEALAAERAGDTDRAAQIRARAAELASHLAAVVAVESAPRLAAEAERQAHLAELWDAAMQNLTNVINAIPAPSFTR